MPRNEAVGRLIGHAKHVDFDAITPEDLGRWINALPLDEFAALIDTQASGEVLSAADALGVGPLEPHGDDWWPCDEQPAPDDAIVWIMELGGPNRASAFLWGADQGDASIIAFAHAVPGTEIPDAQRS